MKPHELQADIRRTGPAPLYLVAGEEAYFRDQAVATIRASVMDESHGAGEGEGNGPGVNQESGFNDDVIYADETDASEILAYAQEVSFFSGRRLIVGQMGRKTANSRGRSPDSVFAKSYGYDDAGLCRNQIGWAIKMGPNIEEEGRRR